jgi:hypothetical protein
MRRTFGITITAGFLMIVAAWVSPASAEPWNGYHHSYHREHWHHGGLNVYIRPWYPVYRPLVLGSNAYPAYRQPQLPAVIREVRLHDDEDSPNSLTTKGTLSTSSGQPRTKLPPMSSRANPESGLATMQARLDEPFRALLLWLFPWANL